ncbi:hypothetical protein PV797_04755 [Clostridiaceae bacterium M8S5]|nr:hypothetical protein PV797_04755 [Clostridiaceae bacterium M8S5]
MKKINLKGLILFILILIFLFKTSILATTSVKMDVNIGFDGLYRAEETTPIRIDVNAYSGLKGTVKISYNKELVKMYAEDDTYTETFNKDIKLLSDEETVYINVTIPKGCERIHISLIDEEGKELAYETKSLKTSAINNQKIVAVYTDDINKYEYIDDIMVDDLADSYFKVLNIKDVKLDDKRILDNFDYIIVNNNLINNIDIKKEETLVKWIKKGGVALIEENTKSKLIDTVKLKEGRKVYDLSMGKIVFIDKDIKDLKNQAYMSYILRMNMNYARMDSKIHTNNMNTLLRHIPRRKLPSIKKIMLILLIYIIIVGPVNYFTLKLYDKREKIWFTSPLIALFITVSIFLTSRGSVFDKAIFNSVTIADLTIDKTQAYVQNEVGITGIKGENVKIGVENNVDFRLRNRIKLSEFFENKEKGGIDYFLDEEKNITLANSNIWDFNYIGTEETRKIDNLIKADIMFNSKGVNGLIKNVSDMMLYDCDLVIGDFHLDIGNLEPGKSISLNKRFDKLYKGNRYHSSNTDMLGEDVKGLILNQYKNTLMHKPYDNIKVIAWNTDKIAGDLKIDDKKERIDRNLLILPVNLGIKKDEIIDFPKGMIKPKIIESPSLVFNSNINTYSNTYSNINTYGKGVCIFELRGIKGLEVEEVSMDLHTTKDNNKVNYYIYNYEDNIWDKLSEETLTIKENINKYYNEIYGLRLKLHSKVETNFYIPEFGIKGVGK